MIRRPPRSTRPDTLFPYTTLVRPLALEADPTWLASMARQRAYAQARPIARAALRPNVSYSYDRARNWSDITETRPTGDATNDVTYNSYSSSFMLSQTLFNAAARARYRAGRAQAEASSDARRAGQGGVSTWRYRWSPNP